MIEKVIVAIMFRSIAGRMYASARQINSSSIPGDSYDFLRSAIHKDNIKITMQVAAVFLLMGGLFTEVAILSSTTTEFRSDLKAMNQSIQKMNESNQVEFKAIGEKFATLEISIRKDMRTESNKIRKEMRTDLNQIQNNMILVLSSRLNENHEKEKPINQMNRNITATNDEVKPTSSMLSNNN